MKPTIYDDFRAVTTQEKLSRIKTEKGRGRIAIDVIEAIDTATRKLTAEGRVVKEAAMEGSVALVYAMTSDRVSTSVQVTEYKAQMARFEIGEKRPAFQGSYSMTVTNGAEGSKEATMVRTTPLDNGNYECRISSIQYTGTSVSTAKSITLMSQNPQLTEAEARGLLFPEGNAVLRRVDLVGEVTESNEPILDMTSDMLGMRDVIFRENNVIRKSGVNFQ